MKQILIIFVTNLLFTSVFGQKIISGNYDSGLRLSFDSTTNKITGYFEMGSGSEEHSSGPVFSCLFYLEGVMTGAKSSIQTYYPKDKKNDLIKGTIEVLGDKEVQIFLPKDHGGCWNVQPFAIEPVSFTLEKRQQWIQMRYVEMSKAYFYSSKSDTGQLKSYLLKGDVVCIEKIDQDWAYCVYLGKKTFKGWMKLTD